MNRHRATRRLHGRASFSARIPTVVAWAAAILSLGACTPQYNWREIHQVQGHYQVMLPAKPVSMSRAIDLDGLHVTMTMTGARVDEAVFTVGAVVLPDAEPATRERATAAMRRAMVRNLAGQETGAVSVDVPVVDAGGRAVATARASRIEAEGRAGDRPAHMTATFVARGDRAWQAVSIAPSLEGEAAKFFHDSLRIAE